MTPFITNKAARLVHDLNDRGHRLGSREMDVIADFVDDYATQLLASAKEAASRDDEQAYRQMWDDHGRRRGYVK
jgi:hypothetical protein